MAKMIGRVYPTFCPICRVESGPDCTDKAKSKRQTKRIEEREWRKEVE